MATKPREGRGLKALVAGLLSKELLFCDFPKGSRKNKLFMIYFPFHYNIHRYNLIFLIYKENVIY